MILECQPKGPRIAYGPPYPRLCWGGVPQSPTTEGTIYPLVLQTTGPYTPLCYNHERYMVASPTTYEAVRSLVVQLQGL